MTVIVKDVISLKTVRPEVIGVKVKDNMTVIVEYVPFTILMAVMT